MDIPGHAPAPAGPGCADHVISTCLTRGDYSNITRKPRQVPRGERRRRERVLVYYRAHGGWLAAEAGKAVGIELLPQAGNEAGADQYAQVVVPAYQRYLADHGLHPPVDRPVEPAAARSDSSPAAMPAIVVTLRKTHP